MRSYQTRGRNRVLILTTPQLKARKPPKETLRKKAKAKGVPKNKAKATMIAHIATNKKQLVRPTIEKKWKSQSTKCHKYRCLNRRINQRLNSRNRKFLNCRRCLPNSAKTLLGIWTNLIDE